MAGIIAPTELLAAVARKVTADAGIRAVAGATPTSWRGDGAAYVTVTQPAGLAPILRGDGTTLVEDGLAQVSYWTSSAVYYGDDGEAPGEVDVRAIVAALDGQILDTGQRGDVEDVRLVPDEGTDLMHVAATVRYRNRR